MSCIVSHVAFKPSFPLTVNKFIMFVLQIRQARLSHLIQINLSLHCDIPGLRGNLVSPRTSNAPLMDSLGTSNDVAQGTPGRGRGQPQMEIMSYLCVEEIEMATLVLHLATALVLVRFAS